MLVQRETKWTSKRTTIPSSHVWVIVLSFLMLLLGLGNLGRAVMALRYAARLPDLPLTAPLAYWAAMGGFWCVAFVGCAVGLVRFRAWGRWSTLAAVTFYQVHVWVNHLLFDTSDYAHQTRPRDLLLTLLLLAFFWGSLNLRGVRKTFEYRESD